MSEKTKNSKHSEPSIEQKKIIDTGVSSVAAKRLLVDAIHTASEAVDAGNNVVMDIGMERDYIYEYPGFSHTKAKHGVSAQLGKGKKNEGHYEHRQSDTHDEITPRRSRSQWDWIGDEDSMPPQDDGEEIMVKIPKNKQHQIHTSLSTKETNYTIEHGVKTRKNVSSGEVESVRPATERTHLAAARLARYMIRKNNPKKQ